MSYKKALQKTYRNKQTVLPSLNAKIKPKVTPAVKPAVPTPQYAPNSVAAALDVGVLHRDRDGYYARFRSQSNPNTEPYVTRIWEVRSGRFVPGDASCNCPGYIFNKHCHHTDDLKELIRNAGSNPSNLPP